MFSRGSRWFVSALPSTGAVSICWDRDLRSRRIAFCLLPTLAGLVIAVLVIHVFPLARGSGVNQTKAALYIYNGYIPLRTAIGKFITAALAIGSGQSLGPEDPSLQIGASLASALGRRMRLSRDRMRLIAPVGAAAGLAAAFNAPISAVLFVIEEVIGRWTAGILGFGGAFGSIECGGHAVVLGLGVVSSEFRRCNWSGRRS